jgi:small subunit ribosomal protein S20
MADEPQKKKERRPTAQKRHLQSLKRNARNRAYKSKIKTRIKALQEALGNKDNTKAELELKEVYSLMDKGVKKGIIKPNKASRTKSRLATKVPAAA